ncbi:hypothetical protein DFQ30_011475 [Apophysomyces sp. BC1015]|nr:hypothetical protein DFQ30_011475 [Apophysomyces sp. BC1015]
MTTAVPDNSAVAAASPVDAPAAAYDPSVKQKAQAKTARIPIKVVPIEKLKKPDWIRVKAATGNSRFYEIKQILREHNLHTVCEEASCPNIGECFGKGTATFMIMGDKCTRRCPFCDVGHGRPDPLDADEPMNLARTIAELKLPGARTVPANADRDSDAGLPRSLGPCAWHPQRCAAGRDEPQPRDGAAALLKDFKALHPDVSTKSGLMVGLGEADEEILQVMRELRAHDVDMLTIGQYLQPSEHHLPVRAYVHPDTFKMYERQAYEMGFTHAAVGAMVRSSYHADVQAQGAGVVAAG